MSKFISTAALAAGLMVAATAVKAEDTVRFWYHFDNADNPMSALVEKFEAANPDIKILSTVAGTFSDPAKGKEIALAQFAQGADVVFPIAGSTGIGALQAAKEQGKLAVGVDSDQAAIFAAGGDEAQADVIFTSVEKKVGESLFLALKDTIDGTAKYGSAVLLGLPDGAVGISKNQWYDKLVPADVRAEIDAVEAKINSGEIVPKTDMK